MEHRDGHFLPNKVHKRGSKREEFWRGLTKGDSSILILYAWAFITRRVPHVGLFAIQLAGAAQVLPPLLHPGPSAKHLEAARSTRPHLGMSFSEPALCRQREGCRALFVLAGPRHVGDSTSEIREVSFLSESRLIIFTPINLSSSWLQRDGFPGCHLDVLSGSKSARLICHSSPPSLKAEWGEGGVNRE